MGVVTEERPVRINYAKTPVSPFSEVRSEKTQFYSDEEMLIVILNYMCVIKCAGREIPGKF